MSRRGRWGEAGYCFSTALALGPDVPPILIRTARYYYHIGEDEKALEHAAQILEKTDYYDRIIFDWYTEKNATLTQILSKGLPPGERATKAYLRYLLKLDAVAEVMQVWNWALSHGGVDEPMAVEYVNFLIQKKNYEAAARSWARYLGDREKGYLKSNWLYNGDFEFEPSGSPFNWGIDKVDGVEVTREASGAHTGARCLRIGFDGQKCTIGSSTVDY